MAAAAGHSHHQYQHRSQARSRRREEAPGRGGARAEQTIQRLAWRHEPRRNGPLGRPAHMANLDDESQLDGAIAGLAHNYSTAMQTDARLGHYSSSRVDLAPQPRGVLARGVAAQHSLSDSLSRGPLMEAGGAAASLLRVQQQILSGGQDPFRRRDGAEFPRKLLRQVGPPTLFARPKGYGGTIGLKGRPKRPWTDDVTTDP